MPTKNPANRFDRCGQKEIGLLLGKEFTLLFEINFN
jgi:hypothetical protein